MAKLFFRYSTMNAGKTIDLIRTNHNYVENNKLTLCFTSSKDNRYGNNKITSRIGLSIDAISITEETNIYNIVKEKNKKTKLSCVFVDESQFLNKKQVYELTDIVDLLDIPVICYGLRSDFKFDTFEGSKFLLALSDEIEELKTLCSECKIKKATLNARILNGEIITKGKQIQIGGNDKYKPMCRKCFKKLTNGNNIL